MFCLNFKVFLVTLTLSQIKINPFASTANEFCETLSDKNTTCKCDKSFPTSDTLICDGTETRQQLIDSLNVNDPMTSTFKTLKLQNCMEGKLISLPTSMFATGTQLKE